MAAMDSPPPQLKASGTLSEKEANEVEVISMPARVTFSLYFTDWRYRTTNYLVLQHHASDYDRYGTQGNHA